MKKASLFLCWMGAFIIAFYCGGFELYCEAGQVYPVCVGDPEDSEQGAAARAFKEFVEDNSGGGIQLDLFYASQLADETEAFHNVASGALPFAIGGTVNLVPFAKKLGILTLPYLFDSLEEAIIGTSGNAGEILQQYALEAGFRVLCWVCSDFRYISNSRHPISRLEHMAGLKFRVPQAPIMIDTYKAFGASPAPVAWGETFTALQQGVVDGQCYGWIGFSSMKFFDARQKFVSECHYTYQVQPLVVSEKFFAAQPPERQKLYIEAGEHARNRSLAYLRERSYQARKELEAKGLVITPLEDEAKWREAALTHVWPAAVDSLGGVAAINQYLRACGKKPWTKP